VPLEENQPELADLEFVAMAKQHPINSFLVDIGAIQRPSVARHVAVGSSLDLDVSTRNRNVVETDLGIGMPPEARDLVFKSETGACLCTGSYDEYADFDRQLANCDYDIVIGTGSILERVYCCERDCSIIERVQRRAAT